MEYRLSVDAEVMDEVCGVQVFLGIHIVGRMLETLLEFGCLSFLFSYECPDLRSSTFEDIYVRVVTL